MPIQQEPISNTKFLNALQKIRDAKTAKKDINSLEIQLKASEGSLEQNKPVLAQLKQNADSVKVQTETLSKRYDIEFDTFSTIQREVKDNDDKIKKIGQSITDNEQRYLAELNNQGVREKLLDIATTEWLKDQASKPLKAAMGTAKEAFRESVTLTDKLEHAGKDLTQERLAAKKNGEMLNIQSQETETKLKALDSQKKEAITLHETSQSALKEMTEKMQTLEHDIKTCSDKISTLGQTYKQSLENSIHDFGSFISPLKTEKAEENSLLLQYEIALLLADIPIKHGKTADKGPKDVMSLEDFLADDPAMPVEEIKKELNKFLPPELSDPMKGALNLLEMLEGKYKENKDEIKAHLVIQCLVEKINSQPEAEMTADEKTWFNGLKDMLKNEEVTPSLRLQMANQKLQENENAPMAEIGKKKKKTLIDFLKTLLHLFSKKSHTTKEATLPFATKNPHVTAFKQEVGPIATKPIN